ncbi:DUF3386 family protein [Singulisphaera sp. Ch08]|uniref:DUF3386 family protein n=1 Tax=Singulisphaera sp. Ch08 TaxID=3120278 RepID=A0AAU7CKQ6_9BACT
MLTLSPLVMTVCAHFLFIRIGPAGEAGRSAEVYFSEQAEAGDPKFVSKVAGTKLWVQTAPGSFQPLEVREGVDRLRAPLPGAENLSVVGSCEYGVLARPKEIPFLLRYYPKAIAGDPDELNRMTPRGEIPLEIMGKVEGDKLRLVLLKQGKPVPGVVFHAVDADLTESEATAGPDGTAVWTPPAPGPYSIYARDSTKQSGEAGGKSYEEIRAFATLALAWPLGSQKADPEAVSLFEQAVAARASWKDFPGFSAKLAGESNGRPYTGTVRFLADGKVDLKVDDPVASPWLKDQFESLAMHRRAEAATGPEDKPILRFADDREDHPLGRLLTFDGGRFASSYRIKGQQIMVVNRRMGPKHLTITVLDNDQNADGKFLPHSYVVHHWDATTGALDRVETVQERWRRVGSWDLPASHTTSTASGGGFSVRSVTLTDHELLKTND